MEVEEEDVILFLRGVFKKESDPGNLTMRMLRESYCKDRNIHQELTREQRQTFATVVDGMFNEFSEAQEAAKAVKTVSPKTVGTKRPNTEIASDEEFQPAKRPKLNLEAQAELSKDDFEPTKLSKLPRAPTEVCAMLFCDELDPRKATRNAANNDNSMPSVGKADDVAHAIRECKPSPVADKDKDVYKTLTSENEKTSSGLDDLYIDTESQNSASTDEERKHSETCANNGSTSKSVKVSKQGSRSSYAGKDPRLAKEPKSSPAATMAGIARGDTCSSGGDSELDKPVPLSSGDDFETKATEAKKKLAKVASGAEEAHSEGGGRIEKDPSAKLPKGKGKKARKKKRNGHKAAKKSKDVTKRSKSDKAKHKKKLKRKKSKKSRKEDPKAGEDGFSSMDEEPLSLIKQTETGENLSGKDDSNGKESDSDAFKKKKSVKKGPKEPKVSKRKTVSTEQTDSELTLLKLYIRETGLRVLYARTFKDSESLESKKKTLRSILADAGIKGQPTLEKCRKLRVQRETKDEVGELDPSNILGNVEGRTRRASHNLSTSPPIQPEKPENSSDSPKKIFRRLKGIVDSENSASE